MVATFLSVGSGDGSQQLACAPRGIKNLTVSFFDAEADVVLKYQIAADHLRELRLLLGPQALVFGVDARALTPALFGGQRRFDQVFFTFPHTVLQGCPARVRQSNQDLLREFFRWVEEVLSPLPHARVTVVLSTSDLYKDWRIESLADGSPLCFVSSRPFNSELYQGYAHRLTMGMAGKLKKVVDKKPHVFLFSRRSSKNSTAPTGSKENENSILQTEQPKPPSSSPKTSWLVPYLPLIFALRSPSLYSPIK